MTVKEIIQQESGNQTTIILLREGIFWKAYEKSAYAFFHQIRPYQPKRKWVQSVKGDLISLGFPMNAEGAVLKDCQVLLRQEDRIVLSALPVEHAEYETWKQSVPMTLPDRGRNDTAPVAERPPSFALPAEATAAGAVKSPLSALYEQLVDSIRHFNLESKTPVECMLFLSELKRKLTELS